MFRGRFGAYGRNRRTPRFATTRTLRSVCPSGFPRPGITGESVRYRIPGALIRTGRCRSRRDRTRDLLELRRDGRIPQGLDPCSWRPRIRRARTRRNADYWTPYSIARGRPGPFVFYGLGVPKLTPRALPATPPNVRKYAADQPAARAFLSGTPHAYGREQVGPPAPHSPPAPLQRKRLAIEFSASDYCPVKTGAKFTIRKVTPPPHTHPPRY